MPKSMLAHHQQPLITIQISKSNMREEVPAKIALCLRRKLQRPRSRSAKLRHEHGPIHPSSRRTSRLPSLQLRAPRLSQPQNQRFFRASQSRLFRLRGPLQRICNSASDKFLKHDQMLHNLSNRPSLRILPKTPLRRTKPLHQLQQPGLTRNQPLQNKFPFPHFDHFQMFTQTISLFHRSSRSSCPKTCHPGRSEGESKDLRLTPVESPQIRAPRALISSRSPRRVTSSKIALHGRRP